MEFYDNPSESDKELITAALDAWFAVGKLGGYNGMNLQVSNYSGSTPWQIVGSTLKMHNIVCV